MKWHLLLAGFMVFLPGYCARGGITVGYVDDFEDGTTAFWMEGLPSPNPPVNIADGGPGGAGDGYLQNVASGSFGAGGRLAMFNTGPNWTGDYLAAGVTEITAMMANFGGTPLPMRVALQGDFGHRFATTQGVLLPADGLWYPVFFDLADMTNVGGTDPLEQVLANVTEMRILSSSSPNWLGDQVSAELGLDLLSAVPEPSAGSLVLAGALLAARLRRTRLNP